MAAPRVPASPVHMAVVLGAGTPSGVVTLEDLLEEFVGEIRTSRRGELPPIMHGAEGRFEADGRLTLDVAERELGVILPPLRPDIETLGAYVQPTWATRCGRRHR